MVNRDLNFDQGEVINHTAEKADGMLTGLAQIGAVYAESAASSKLMAQSAKAQVAFKQLDAQFRMKYADDPMSAEGLKELQEGRQQVVEELGGGVSSLMNRQWQEKTTELATASDLSNDLWATKQNQTNTVSNVNNSIKSYLDMANTDGRAFGASGGSSDGSNIMNYITAGQEIADFGSRTLGKAETDKLLEDFNKDYIKSFVSGVAENNPESAKDLLDSPELQAAFTTQERGEMIDQIAKVRRQQQTASDLSVTITGAGLTDLVNDNELTYYEKRARIDELDMAGAVSPSAAAKARRVLSSKEDLDTQTSTPIMADLINRTYDLNAIADTSSTEYLQGVRNLQEEVMERQANGELAAKDAMTVNKQITTLTSAKLASATQTAGNEFYDANQMFNTLPAEYRGQATRSLFYASDNKGFTDEQYKTQARTIIDDINAQRRKKALSVVKSTSVPDDQFLKQNNYTEEDITETMQVHGLSREEVISTLRKHKQSKKK